MSQDTLKIEDQDNELTISLRSNPLDEKTYIGSIKRQTITLNALASRITDSESGISEYEVIKIAGYLKKEILKALKRGQAINVLGLGVLYLIPESTISTETPNEALNRALSIRFKPSDEVYDAVSDVKINTVTISDPTPQITSTESIPYGEDGTAYETGKAVHISGSKLKIGGDDSGIFLCKVDSEGNITQTTEVSEELYIRNKTTEVEFFIPEDLEEGDYRIKLATRYINSSTTRKSLISGFSNVISISKTA